MSQRMSALALWDRELRAGVNGQDRFKPSTWVQDWLWYAACHEAAAREFEAQGLPVCAAGEWAKMETSLVSGLEAPDTAVAA